MTEQPPIPQFGKRRPAIAAPVEPVKRSRHVALLFMGTMAVGGAAYALMPREACAPRSPAMAAPALPQQDTTCARGGSSGGGYSRSSRLSFFGDSASRSSSDAEAGGVTRGGFGSFARAFGFSGSS